MHLFKRGNWFSCCGWMFSCDCTTGKVSCEGIQKFNNIELSM